MRRSQERWKAVRTYLNGHRPQLTAAALELYPEGGRVMGAALFSPSEWIPPAPVDLADVALEWSGDVPQPAVTGEEEESRLARPLRAPGVRYRRYADAVRELDRPLLFENRTSYRLLDVGWSGAAHLGFGRGRYFDVIDICEAAAHELAEVVLEREERRVGGPLTLGQLPFRSLIGDPLDMARRPMLPAISALTLRRDPSSGSGTFVLHWRDPSRVASGGGLYQVMPVGMFQPAGESAADLANDFDLWRSMAREYSEEFLGAPEHQGVAGAPIAYESWPFYRALEDARARGEVRAWLLGVGVDPLTLVTDILIVVVIDADVFDSLFGRSVIANEEGRIVTAVRPSGGTSGIAFSRENVDDITRTRPMQPAGAALLRLAWRHRALLL